MLENQIARAKHVAAENARTQVRGVLHSCSVCTVHCHPESRSYGLLSAALALDPAAELA